MWLIRNRTVSFNVIECLFNVNVIKYAKEIFLINHDHHIVVDFYVIALDQILGEKINISTLFDQDIEQMVSLNVTFFLLFIISIGSTTDGDTFDKHHL